MKCKACGKTKLLREFPSFDLAENCNHEISVCLRCVVKHNEDREKESCPHPKCQKEAVPGTISMCKKILNSMFEKIPSYPSYSTECQQCNDGERKKELSFKMLSGELIAKTFDKGTMIKDIKLVLAVEIRRNPVQLRIIRQNKEMKDYIPRKSFEEGSQQPATLDDYDVKSGETLRLLVLLYDVPTIVTDVTFEIRWTKGDHKLDACCYIFSGMKKLSIIYLNQKQHDGKRIELKLPWYKKIFKWTGFIKTTEMTDAVQHTGDFEEDNVMSQKITVLTQNIEVDVSHIFFTLSARDASNLGSCEDIQMKFYETKKPSIELCGSNIHHASGSPSVIVCSMERAAKYGEWNIFECGRLSKGKAEEPELLINTLTELIES